MSDATSKLASPLTLHSVTTRAFRVPMKFALGTSVAVITFAPFVLVDAQTEEGVVGRSYVFCYATSAAKAIAAHIAEAGELIRGQPCLPQSVAMMLSRVSRVWYGITLTSGFRSSSVCLAESTFGWPIRLLL